MAKKSSSRSHKPKEVPEVGVRLSSCRVIGFLVSLPDENPSGKAVSFTTSVNFDGDPNKGTVLVTVGMDGAVEAEGKEPETVISILTLTTFTIRNPSELKKGEKGTPIIPGWIVATMVSVAVGTTRGILLEKLANTIYRDIVIPILGLSQFLTKSPKNAELDHGI